MQNQPEPGHCCPLVMTFAAVPAIRASAAAAATATAAGQGNKGWHGQWEAALTSGEYDGRDLPLHLKRGATVSWWWWLLWSYYVSGNPRRRRRESAGGSTIVTKIGKTQKGGREIELVISRRLFSHPRGANLSNALVYFFQKKKKGGMSMTEKQGGSDVQTNTTTARELPKGSFQNDEQGNSDTLYELTGHKWYFFFKL